MVRAEDVVKSLGARLTPSPTDASELPAIGEALHRVGYTWEGVAGLLEVPDLTTSMGFMNLPGYVWRCLREDSPRAHMAMLFLLGEAVARHRVEAVLGASGVDALLRRDLLVVDSDPDQVRSRVDLYPFEGAFVFADRVFGPARQREHVYEPGNDSVGLARATPRRLARRALDLCSGSGIQAILCARAGITCVGVDLYARPVAFATVNATMNGVSDRCTFARGNLYEAVRGLTFDLIVANPPWVPTLETDMHRHRTGGVDGEDATRAIVAGLPTALEEGGTLAMAVNYPVIRGSRYVDRIASWLGGVRGWGIAVLDFGVVPLEEYIRWHMTPAGDLHRHRQQFAEWMAAYELLGIEAMAIGNVYLRRLPPTWPSWTAHKRGPRPQASVVGLIEDWLDGLARFHAPGWSVDWEEWKPCLNPLLDGLWLDARGQRGRAEDGWSDPVALDADEAWLTARATGHKTAARLAEGFAAHHGLQDEIARRRVAELLAALGARQVLR